MADEKQMFINDNLYQILNTVAAAIYTTDTEGRLTYCNSEAAQLFGNRPEPGTDHWNIWKKLYKPNGTPMSYEESPVVIALNEERSLKGQKAIAERPDGKRLWVESYPAPLRNEDGDIIGGINMILDITNRKMAEKALEESEYRYRTLFESIDQGFAIIDIDFDAEDNPEEIFLLKTNAAFEKNTGVKNAEGKTLGEIVAERDVDLSSEWYEIMGKVAKTGNSLHFEKKSEGSGRYFDVFAFPFDHHNTTKVAVLIDDISDRKAHEHANARLAAIVNSSQDAIISKDLEGTITTWNSAAEKMFGYTENEVVGKSVTVLFPEDRIEEETEILAKLRNGERIEHYETVRVKKNNEPINVSLSISPVINDSGQVIGASKIARNITERKRAEEERERLLQQVENERARLVNIFNQAPSFMCILRGPNHVFERANDLFYKLIGDRDIIGKPVHEALPETEAQGFVKKLNEVYQTDESYRRAELPVELNRDSGHNSKLEKRYINFVFQPFHNPDGSVSGIFIQGLDITERKETEQALIESEEKYRTLFESMDEGYCIIKMIFDENDNPVDYQFLEVNEAFEKHTGMKDVVGKTIREVISEPEEQFFEVYGKVVKKQESVRFEQPAKELDRILSLYAYPFGEPGKQKVAVLFNDITEQKRNQQKLRQMNVTLEEKVAKRTASLKSYQEQLRRLAYELSKTEERERQRLATDLHDNLGQLLAVGKMRLESLNRVGNSEDVTEGVDDLKSIIDDAIDYSRKLVTDLKPPPSLDMENLQESIRWIAEKMQKHGLDVAVNDDGKPKDLCEEVRTTIFQCVRELLFNVIKHAGVNKAKVSMTRQDGFIEVTIEDKGKGFEFTGKQPTPTKEGGFGLFSVRERLNVVGGSLNIVSQPGEGTRVAINVPVKAAEDDAELPQGQVSTSSYPYEQEKLGKITKVLIVDDHRMMREGLRKMIEDEEDMMVIAEASDGKEAIEMAREHQVDVIVMDVNMPKLNGIDATQQILARHPEMRVIGLSFHKEDSVAKAMHEAGASAYLTKSDVFETLCATIRSEAQATEQ